MSAELALITENSNSIAYSVFKPAQVLSYHTIYPLNVLSVTC